MRFGVCLHGAAALHGAAKLHATDRNAIALGKSVGAEIVALELVSERGVSPLAAAEALAVGADRALRLVEPALASCDARGVGYAAATVLDSLGVDLILFGMDADANRLGNVPAHIAHHLSALYLVGATEMRQADPATPRMIGATLRGGGWIRKVGLPLKAVLGIAADAPPSQLNRAGIAAGNPRGVEVVTLDDFKLDAASLTRQPSLRSRTEPAGRPLVTLHSAAAVGALLRKTT